MERTCGTWGGLCDGKGELRGPGFEGTPRDPRKDSCHRRVLSDLGIAREEMGDAVMELRLRGGVPAAQSGGRGPATAATPRMLLISGDVRQWHQQSSVPPPTGFGWDCREAVLFPETGWICQGRGAECEHPPGAERCRLLPAVPIFIHHILLQLPPSPAHHLDSQWCWHCMQVMSSEHVECHKAADR